MTPPSATRPVLTRDMELFLRAASGSASPVLIDGPTGTGKNVLAKLIHERGPRRAGRFVSVGCATLTESLASATLFGAKAGAWTDLRENRRGFVAQADRGTLVLNDADTLPVGVQAMLLDFLDTGTYVQSGEVKPRTSDVRLIVTTNRRPAELVRKGMLRKDLYGRLSEHRFTCPTLAARSDIREVAVSLLRDLIEDERPLGGARRSTRVALLTPDAIEVIANHRFWPTNFRGLIHLLGDCLRAGDGEAISATLVERKLAERMKEWSALGAGARTSPSRPRYRWDGTVEEEKRRIEGALERWKGNLSKAAPQLGMTRATLYRKIDRHRIDLAQFRRAGEGPGAAEGTGV